MKRSDDGQDPSELTDRWSVSYSRSERSSGDTCRNVDMSWENRTPAQIMENLNAFLVAVGAPLKVVPARGA